LLKQGSKNPPIW